MVIVDNKYEHLRSWIEQLPRTFNEQGTIIYNARNQIRVIVGPDGKQYNVKRYCCPAWYNRFIYSTIRKPKAVRAYENAQLLSAKGIPTPAVIGYILCGDKLITESYLITEQAPHKHLFYELGDGIILGREKMLVAFGQFAGRMHENGVLHFDFSPGNILYDWIDDNWEFTLVDINRMRFGKVGKKEGCKNFSRLWGGRKMYQLIAEGYALTRGMEKDECCRIMFRAHQHFWKNRKMPKAEFPVVNE